MFANSDVVTQPIFYLFIAFSVLLSLGYSWGKRRNARILHSAMEGIADALRPRDQQYTNIGGQTGFHANFLPGALDSVRRVDVTMTLLPRQSWLYLPFSLLTRKFDRLYMSYELNKRGRGLIEEGHLIDAQLERMRGHHIENVDALTREELDWGGRTFYLYAASEQTRGALLDLRNRLGDHPGGFRHVALVPEQDRYYTFMIPHKDTVGGVVQTVSTWFEWYLKQRLSSTKA